MPDDLPDIHTPLPDEAHEALRAGLVAQVDTLASEVERINGALLLLRSTAGFAQSTLSTARAARAALDATAGRLVELEKRVATLEASTTTAPVNPTANP